MKPERASLIPEEQLKVKPFFKPFEPASLYSSEYGPQVARDDRLRHLWLGTALPALSFAAGANAVDLFEGRQFDMNAFIRYGWPTRGGVGTNWLHSDFLEVCFYYTQTFYRKLFETTELDQ